MPKLRARYAEDAYFRTTLNVLALQLAFVILIILVLGAAIWHQQAAFEKVAAARRAAISAGQTLTPQSLTYSLEGIQDQTLGVSFAVLIFLASVFGFIGARYALSPTRNSLAYQKRFIGNIAHELRTPLAIIRTNTEVALMDKSLSEYSRSTFVTTVEEIDRISETINNLLSFNSLMRSEQLKREPVQMGTLLSNVVGRHAELADSHGIDLSLQTIDSLYVFGNQTALEQVFTNLIKNALNYTPRHEGRTVAVTAKSKDEEVSVIVSDTGIGIAQKDLYHIFEPFYQGDTSRTRNVGGGTSGLGLAIVNDIVRAHGGSILIRSALNRGTSIEISLPMADTTAYVQGLANSEDAGDADEHEALVIS